MIVSGYDEDRSEQFIATFEPRETLIMFQNSPSATDDDNRVKNEERHKRRFGSRGGAVAFRGVDCYGADWGFSAMMAAARGIGRDSNLRLVVVLRGAGRTNP